MVHLEITVGEAPTHFRSVAELVNVITEYLAPIERIPAASVNRKWRTVILWDGFSQDWELHRDVEKAGTMVYLEKQEGGCWRITGGIYWALFFIFVISAGLTPSAEARGWCFIGFSAFLGSILFVIHFVMMFGYSLERNASTRYSCVQRASWLAMCLIMFLNFLSFWALSFSVDVRALGVDTNGFQVLDACDRSSFGPSELTKDFIGYHPHGLLQLRDHDNRSVGRWTAGSYAWSAKKKENYNFNISGPAVFIMKANSQCQVNIHPSASEDWQERLEAGEPIYCGYDSFYFPGADMREGRGYGGAKDDRAYEHTYGKDLQVPLCRSFPPLSASVNPEFALRLLITAVCGIIFAFLVWLSFLAKRAVRIDVAERKIRGRVRISDRMDLRRKKWMSEASPNRPY